LSPPKRPSGRKSGSKSKRPAKSGHAKVTDWRALVVSTDDAGSIIKVSGERVRQLTKAGWIKKSGSNAYRIGDVLDGYLAYRDDLEQKAAADTPQARLAATKRRAIEQRMAREDGQLIETDDVFAVVADILGTFRSELAGIPAAATRDLDARLAIEGALNGAIDRCRDRFQQAERDLRAGREVLVESEETGA